MTHILNWIPRSTGSLIVPCDLTYFYPRSQVPAITPIGVPLGPPKNPPGMFNNQYMWQDPNYKMPNPFGWNIVPHRENRNNYRGMDHPQSVGGMNHLLPFTPFETSNRFEAFSGLDDCE